MIVLNEAHVRRLLRAFVEYSHTDRTHLSVDYLDKDLRFHRYQ